MLDTCWPLQLAILLLVIRLMPFRLVPPTQAVEINRFHCDTKERIEQIQNLKYYLKRFIRHDNRIYFVLSDRVIFMELQLDNKQIDQNLYKFFNAEDDPVKPVKAHSYSLYHYVSFDLYEQENEEILLPDAVPNRYKVFGHIYEQKRNGINKTVEFYAVHQKDLNPDRTTAEPINRPVERRSKIERFEMFNQSFRLNFDLKHPNSVLAERDGPEEARYLSKIFLNPMDGSEPQFVNIVYFNRIFVVDSGGEGQDLLITVFYDQHELNSTYTEAQLAAALVYQNDNKEKKHQTYLLSNKDDYRLFVFYMRDLDFGFSKLYNNQPIYFVGFDESSLFEFSVYDFYQDKHQLYRQLHVEPTELFDCFTKLTHERQLKGILYDHNSELFFVFIKRFYLRIHQIDLVEGELVLESDWYTQKAQRLVHRPAIEGIFEKIDPEFLGRKWVKEIGPNAYYTPDNRNFFRLAVHEKDALTIQRASGSGFESCYHQTLLVDEKHVFCFRKREYFFLYSLGNESYSRYWNKNRYSIAELFEETALDWTNQELLLIFNYKEDRFVMLTQSDLFIFEYTKFALWPGVIEEEHKIRYLHDLDDKQIKRKRNCLLLGCKRPDSSTESSLTTPIDEPTGDNHMALTLLFLVLLAIILSVLVLSVFVTHVLRSNLFTKYNKYFRQPKSKDLSKSQKKKYKFTMKVKK